MTQSGLWIAAAVFAGLAAMAFVADHLRTRRRDLDKVGWVPWNLIQIFAIILAAAAAAFAIRS